MKTLTRLSLLGTLYLSQGLPFGFFTQALPAWLRQQGVSLEAIGLSSLLAIPWGLKFLWAPLVDSWSPLPLGRRRGWIIPLQFLAAALSASLAWLDPQGPLAPLLVAIFALNLLAATQDIATDGLAVELLPFEERGLGNGVQVAGYRVGMILGGGVLLILFEHLGWSGTFWAMGALLALATLPILFYRERSATLPQAAVPSQSALRGSPLSLRHARLWKQPGIWRWLLVLLVYKTGDSMGRGMLRPFLVDDGMSLGEIGWLLGTLGFTAGLLGALLGGAAVNSLGRHRALVGFGVLQAITVAAYALPALGADTWVTYLACAVEHLASGMATAALFTAMMDRCSQHTAATDYTIQASLVVVATGGAAALSGFSAAALGYPGHFLLAAGVCALGVLALPLRAPQHQAEQP